MERHFDMVPFYVPSVISPDAPTENTFQFNPTSNTPPSTGCSDRECTSIHTNVKCTSVDRMSRQGHQEINSRMHPSLEGSRCIRNDDFVLEMSERHLVTS